MSDFFITNSFAHLRNIQILVLIVISVSVENGFIFGQASKPISNQKTRSVLKKNEVRSCTGTQLSRLKLRGLYLDMTLSDAKKLLPNAETESDVFKLSTIRLYYRFSQGENSLGRFKGVKSVNASFFENRLFRMETVYDASIKWNSIEEFGAIVARELGLPPRWEDILHTAKWQEE